MAFVVTMTVNSCIHDTSYNTHPLDLTLFASRQRELALTERILKKIRNKREFL
jgi:hypothetical protein